MIALTDEMAVDELRSIRRNLEHRRAELGDAMLFGPRRGPSERAAGMADLSMKIEALDIAVNRIRAHPKEGR